MITHTAVPGTHVFLVPKQELDAINWLYDRGYKPDSFGKAGYFFYINNDVEAMHFKLEFGAQ